MNILNEGCVCLPGIVIILKVSPMKNLFAFAALFACSAFFFPEVAKAQADVWEPGKTYVFVASVMKWPAKAELTEIAGEQREKQLIDQLQKMGVPEENIIYLTGREATRDAMRSEWKALGERAGKGSTLMFYFQGHGLLNGKNAVLASYDINGEMPEKTGFRTEEIFPLLKEWTGNRLILFGDCCYSGALTNVVKMFDQYRPNVRAAALPSAMASNSSTGEWTYTNALIKAFSGYWFTDRDQDGKITFSEMEEFTRGELKFGDDQLTRAVRTKSWKGDFTLSTSKPWPAVPESELAYEIGHYLEARDSEGDWYGARIIGWRKEKPSWRVHFCGWDDQYNEWVDLDRLRPFERQKLLVGKQYEVQWDDEKWHRATLTRNVEDFFYFAHYEGNNGDADEWVTAVRTRPVSQMVTADTAEEKPARFRQNTTPERSTFVVGQKVAARWNSEWYLAEISDISNGLYDVTYEDGDTGQLSAKEIFAITDRDSLNVGDRVLASYQDGANMFPAKITEIKGRKVTVAWEDGDTPENVSIRKVAKIQR